MRYKLKSFSTKEALKNEMKSTDLGARFPGRKLKQK